jgi:hypothetical protein
MPIVNLYGATSKTFATQAEATAFRQQICDAQEKRRCLAFVDDNEREWVLLPSGAYIYTDPS